MQHEAWEAILKQKQKQKKNETSLQKINAGENVEERELSYTIGGNVNWCSCYGKQYGVSSKH